MLHRTGLVIAETNALQDLSTVRCGQGPSQTRAHGAAVNFNDSSERYDTVYFGNIAFSRENEKMRNTQVPGTLVFHWCVTKTVFSDTFSRN